MSQTRMVPAGQHPDTDVVMKENAAAAALVDVAAGFVKNASDSASAGGLLPTNNASRKQWDREQAAPPTDHGITSSSSGSSTAIRRSGDETLPSASSSKSSAGPAPASVSTGPTVHTTTTTIETPIPTTTDPGSTNYEHHSPPPSGLTSYHVTGTEHHPVAASGGTTVSGAASTHVPPPQPLSHPQVPHPVSHPQVPMRPQPPPRPTPESAHWPPPGSVGAPPTHQPPPPPPGYPHPSHHPSGPPPPPPPPPPHHVTASHIHHGTHAHHPHHHPGGHPAVAHHPHFAHHPHAAPPPHPAAHNSRQHHPTAPAPAPVAQQQPASAVLMSMSSIGFGVAPASSSDATEAVIRAVQDSMERSAVRLPTVASLRQSLTIHLKLGVPPKASGEPMNVDVSRLSLFLPQSVPVLPVEVVVGGLLIDHKEIEESTMKPTTAAGASAVPTSSQQPTICTAVACVTLQQSAPETVEQSKAATGGATAAPGVAVDAGLAPGLLGVRTPPTTTAASPWAHVPIDQQPTHHAAPTAMASVPPPTLPQQVQQHHVAMPPLTGNISGGRAVAAGPPPPATNPSTKVHRTNSMEVLAHISGEIRDRQINASKNNGGGGEMTAALAMVCSSEAASLEARKLGVDGNSAAYSYKKLAPGVTPKGSKRLFVRHDYKDYSREQPQPEEQFLVRSDAKTPNAAFPLKLHETLSQIEADGYGHIIGWMPHGRSFKIFQQQDFVDVVLPRYFVMTKKSSFLRQLNLYNFNRISVGPDSGSYYHEKFLRGLKFLCRRMSRQKVNGNGIRAAGNPDDEPTLANYPSCPPKPGGSNSCDSSTVSQNEADDQDAESKDNGERPYSRLVGGPQSRPYSQAVRSSSQQATATEKEAMVGTDESTTQDGIGVKIKVPPRHSRTDSSSSSQPSFPLKLQRILDKADAEGKSDIISWLPHGRAFLVHDVERFVSEVMSNHFNQTKYSSFQRQLHMYNFQRITFGRDKGAYHHEKFERGRPDLCMTMVRTRVNGKGCRRPGDPDNEPDFYVDWEASEGSPGGGNESQGEKQGDAAMECVQGEPV